MAWTVWSFVNEFNLQPKTVFDSKYAVSVWNFVVIKLVIGRLQIGLPFQKSSFRNFFKYVCIPKKSVSNSIKTCIAYQTILILDSVVLFPMKDAITPQRQRQIGISLNSGATKSICYQVFNFSSSRFTLKGFNMNDSQN